jgi:amino acid permease
VHAGARKGKAVLLPFQLLVLVGIAVTYVVVGGDNLAAFAEGVAGRVLLGKWAYYIMFGGLQLLLSLVSALARGRGGAAAVRAVLHPS